MGSNAVLLAFGSSGGGSFGAIRRCALDCLFGIRRKAAWHVQPGYVKCPFLRAAWGGP